MLCKPMHFRKLAALALVVFPGGGCFSRDPISLTSNHAPQKIPAIVGAAQHGDREAIPQLVRDLDSDDPAVRFYAIEGLERLTGETFGYVYYQDATERRPAVMRWRKWLEENHRPSDVAGPAK